MTTLIKEQQQEWPQQLNYNESSTVRKRTRATADQLSVLEDTFAVNVSPNSKLRKQLAEQLNMTERSIQIWFQNRRAKVKHLQKKQQIQMHQASIRAQLYQPYLLPSSYYNNKLRAQSVDVVQHSYSLTPPPPPPPPSLLSTTTATPSMSYSHYLSQQPWIAPELPLTRQSMPPQLYHSSSIPTLISVPDAGPTAVLSTDTGTINPSNLMIQAAENKKEESKQEEKQKDDDNKEDKEEKTEPKDLYLSANTLTIGSWHRLKMQETDLVCVYRPDTKIFAWHIIDSGCHFKMEVAQQAVSSIEFVMDENEALADVHFDISEPPLFYMESTSNNEQPIWIQCSDFTEGKQASRFFRHSLKGAGPALMQELLALIDNHQETKRLVHFVDNNLMYPQPFIVESQPFSSYLQPIHDDFYWPNSTNHLTEPIACELYLS